VIATQAFRKVAKPSATKRRREEDPICYRTDDRGRLTGLTTLPWQFVTPWVADDGALLFDFLPALSPNAGKRRRYTRDDYLFMKDRSDDGVIGRSRISRAAQSLQSALQLQVQSTAFFGNMSRPAGTLNAPGRISRETADRLAND
jgi:phage portal protein BeeE